MQEHQLRRYALHLQTRTLFSQARVTNIGGLETNEAKSDLRIDSISLSRNVPDARSVVLSRSDERRRIRRMPLDRRNRPSVLLELCHRLAVLQER